MWLLYVSSLATDRPGLTVGRPVGAQAYFPHIPQNLIYKIMHVAQFNKLKLEKYYCYEFNLIELNIITRNIYFY